MLEINQQVPLAGDEYFKIKNEINSIIVYQISNGVRNGLKGFILYGEAGVGKTRLISEIMNTLSRDHGFSIIKKDAADIAHKHYGESEKLIKEIFAEKRGERRAIFFDDVDGLFLTRDYGVKLETWYLSHLNVLFHMIDKLDTSQDVLFMTTNKIDLVDFALRDRLYNIEIPHPSHQSLKEYLNNRLEELFLKNTDMNITEVAKPIIHEIDTGIITNFRKLEQKIIIEYVNYVKSVEL
jgi:SpoVK/Ycf46/Vps4 family AAA+-type ATPase